ncbi:uncharacterized protein AB675_907 [Cyphellophora attinorum]|uniref:F-box domain-containing protein n=1 Tax=Cyphellophora attinorum TaxID=1664694 RepID=A0A0N0NRW1_9EURO|nr:uncharacterized protein AB675_907 [Phialophora attinorum]KPI45551.1 hypothetical protein AB675_907 [Phialophora attinorum]
MAPKRKRRDNRPGYARKRRKSFVHQGPENFEFLRLPSELRHEVYKKILPGRLPSSRTLLNRKCYGPEFPILARCRAGGKDTLRLARYSANDIRQHVETDGASSLLLGSNNSLTAPFNLAKVCRVMRDEVLSFFLNGFHLRIEHVGIACWYATLRPLLPSNLMSLEIITPIEECNHLQQRWLAKLVEHFPRLDYLRISGIHTHKSASHFGTRYKIGYLLVLKSVLENTNFQRVFTVPEDGNGCKQQRSGGCTPNIAFVTNVGFQKHCQDTAEQSFSEIFVEEEIVKSRGSKHATNMKRLAQL